jgi:AraC-like DNA-binding protein
MNRRMTDQGLELEQNYHPAGEYRFTPDALTLSFCRQRVEVEQVDEARVWFGTCLRNDVKVMPRGRERIFRHRQGCRFACITIPDSRAFDAAQLVELRPQLTLRDLRLTHVLEALLVEFEAGAETRLFRDAVAEAVVARLVELDTPNRPASRTRALAPALLARVLDYLHAHLSSEVSVNDLASVAGMSPAYFATLFRASVGEPPHRHHVRLRIEHARSLLEQGADPVGAALATGFCDQSHLARHMQRLWGITPGAIARSRGATRKGPHR